MFRGDINAVSIWVSIKGKYFTCVVLFAAAMAQAIVIDFEAPTFPSGTPPSNFLAPYGIASVTYDNGPYQIRNIADPDLIIPSGVQVFLPSPGPFPSGEVFANTTLTFSTPVSYFSFTKVAEAMLPYTYGIPGWQLTGFDDSNNLIAQVGVGYAAGLDYPSPGPPTTYTLQGASPLSSVVISVHYNGFSTAGSLPMDDFAFEPIPEPSTYALTGLFLLCVLAAKQLGLFRRSAAIEIRRRSLQRRNCKALRSF